MFHLFRRHRADEEISEELAAHIEERASELRDSGMPQMEARQQARREFGNQARILETSREVWTWTWLEHLAQDLQYAARQLRRSPGFATVAVLSLALGIGANTAIFSVMDALLLRNLAIPNPQELVTTGYTGQLPYPLFQQFRQRTQSFASFSGIRSLNRSNVTLNGGAPDPREVPVSLVSGDYFAMMDVAPAIGRTFTADDDRTPGGHPMAVISDRYWQSHWASSPDVVGQTFTLNGTIFTILGVLPARFSGDTVGRPTDLWIPMTMHDQVELERLGLLENPNAPWVRVVARLKPGISMDSARAEVLAMVRADATQRLGPNPTAQQLANISKIPATLISDARGLSESRRMFEEPLVVLVLVVAITLLIACANVASLLLVRAAARGKEMAMRLALGAGPGRLIRQLLTESVLLAGLGGACGLLLAGWGAQVLVRFAGSGLAQVDLDVSLDARILAFTITLTLLTGLLLGLAPALRVHRVTLGAALKGEAREGQTRFGLGRALVVSQVALSLVLLIGAGLFLRTLYNLRSQDLGFDREHVFIVWWEPLEAGISGPALKDLFERAENRIAAIPGVRSVGASIGGLLSGGGNGSPVIVPGHVPEPNELACCQWNLVGSGYLPTIGMRLSAGRNFTEFDRENTPRVAIVNESMASHYFGRKDVVGMRFGMRRDTGNEIEIVGVVTDAKYNTLRDADQSMIYLPYRQDTHYFGVMSLMVRSAAESPGLLSRVRDELRGLYPTLPLHIDSMEENVDKSIVQERLTAWLSGLFGTLAVFLACMGLYGVMSYVTERRTAEIGVRLALGATPRSMLSSVLRESLLLVAIGIALGVPTALAASHWIGSLLFGVQANDATTIAGASVLMIGVAVVAALLPARRAARVDPMVALRHE